MRDQYEKDRYWIDYEEVQDKSSLELHYQLDLGIINDEQYDQLIKEQELKRDRENQDREDKIKKFRNLVDELEMSLDPDSMKLLRDCKALL